MYSIVDRKYNNFIYLGTSQNSSNILLIVEKFERQIRHESSSFKNKYNP